MSQELSLIQSCGPGQGLCAGSFFGLAVGFNGAIGAGLKLFGPGRLALLVGCTEELDGVGAGALSLDPHAGNTTAPAPASATSQIALLGACIAESYRVWRRSKAATALSVW